MYVYKNAYCWLTGLVVIGNPKPCRMLYFLEILHLKSQITFRHELMVDVKLH